jgi:hypothetical protein
MGLFDRLFKSGSTSPSNENSVPQSEHFPKDEYAPAYAVSVSQEDLAAVDDLIASLEQSETLSEQSILLSKSGDDPVRESGEELIADIQEIMMQWQDQMESNPSSVWWPVGADSRFRSFLYYCEQRDQQDEDEFTFPASIGRVHSLVERCMASQEREDNAKLAIVYKDNVPLNDTT